MGIAFGAAATGAARFCAVPAMGLGGACTVWGEATLDAMPERPAEPGSEPSLTLAAAPLVSRRGGCREEPREGRLGLDSMLLERSDPPASYFSRSFSQLQPGSTARLLILSMSARLRELLASAAMPLEDVDDCNADCWAYSLEPRGALRSEPVLGFCERDGVMEALAGMVDKRSCESPAVATAWEEPATLMSAAARLRSSMLSAGLEW